MGSIAIAHSSDAVAADARAAMLNEARAALKRALAIRIGAEIQLEQVRAQVDAIRELVRRLEAS